MNAQLKITWFFLFFCTSFLCMGQDGSFRYSGQYYFYGQHNLTGIRQSLSYHHLISNRLSISGQIFSGTGRGRDVSGDFKKDYVLLSMNNWQNVPGSLTTGFNSFSAGIYNYKRIAEGLSHDLGWGLSLFYNVYAHKKLSIDMGLGYLNYTTKLILRNTVFDIAITDTPSQGDLVNYRVTYPAPLILDYNDGAFTFNTHLAYQVHPFISLGASLTFNNSPYTSANDFGAGLIFKYTL